MDSLYGIMEDAVKDHNDRMQKLRRYSPFFQPAFVPLRTYGEGQYTVYCGGYGLCDYGVSYQ